MEDGVAVAVALHRAKGDVPLALRVFERIRFHRSHVTHMASISTRDGYHNVDWDGDLIRQNPELVNLPRPKWVIEHDAAATLRNILNILQLMSEMGGLVQSKSFRCRPVETMNYQVE